MKAKKFAKFIAITSLLLAVVCYFWYPDIKKLATTKTNRSSTATIQTKQWTLCIKLECNAKPACSKATVSIDPKTLRVLYIAPGTNNEIGIFKATSENSARYDGTWEWARGNGEFYLEKISPTLYKGAWRDSSSKKDSEREWDGHDLRLTQSPI